MPINIHKAEDSQGVSNRKVKKFCWHGLGVGEWGSLIYRVNCKTLRATERNPVSKNKKQRNEQTNKQTTQNIDFQFTKTKFWLGEMVQCIKVLVTMPDQEFSSIPRT